MCGIICKTFPPPTYTRKQEQTVVLPFMSTRISNHESESFELYLQEVNRQPELGEADEKSLFERLAHGDVMARERLVAANLRHVLRVARQYSNKGLAVTDLVNEGNIGLIQAVDKFDASRGGRFVPFAVWHIRQAVQNAIAEQSRIVRVPAAHVSQLNRLNRLRALFEQEHQRRPNVNEMASGASIPEPDVMKTMSASARQCSVDAPFAGRQAVTMADMLRDSDAPQTDDAVTADSLKAELCNVIEKLRQRERDVICAFYGIGVPSRTFAEIGRQYGMTRERARQIRNKAVRHMRSLTDSAALRSFLKV